MAQILWKEQYRVDAEHALNLGVQKYNKFTKELVRGITNAVYEILQQNGEGQFLLQVGMLKLDKADIDYMQYKKDKENATEKGC